MKNFIALPVGQGDAFYLKHNDFSVLIDGGKSVQKLPELFKENTKTNEVGVLVCTHNDADHANGILGFLDSLPISNVTKFGCQADGCRFCLTY
ncbi:MAG: MBL fold metallo-hydrolase [Nitrosomonas sp.]|uniref:MBL fold metallo-hydrolase n=1 Tax=Nitrosomonas sp. TaxID=42353 RepID=UPI0032EC7E79